MSSRRANQRDGTFPGSGRNLSAFPLVLPLLHGAAGLWDEIMIFGGIGVILLGLSFLSWRNSRARKRRRRRPPRDE